MRTGKYGFGRAGTTLTSGACSPDRSLAGVDRRKFLFEGREEIQVRTLPDEQLWADRYEPE
jgi:hypothetical protein